MNTPKRKTTPLFAALLGAVLLLPNARAEKEDCGKWADKYQDEISLYTQKANEAESETEKNQYNSMVTNFINRRFADRDSCLQREKENKEKERKLAKEESDCNAKAKEFSNVYSWDAKKHKCINKSDTASSRSLPSSDDCNSASLFSGDLKGQNCKKALDTTRDVKARNSALTEATTAATTAYSAMQANGATGAQEDAQTRQANIMKTLAMSKIATGALSLTGAMQLKSAASGAEDASSTITGAQKQLMGACGNSSDDQACFFQNAQKFGISPDSQSYASFARMKQGASQSQDQADAANALAKTSMISGAADLLVGLQALKAAQMANNNAAQMAPPPLAVAPPPPSQVSLGSAQSGTSAPSLEPGAAAPGDYAAPTDPGTFGAQHTGRIGGSVKVGNMGAPMAFRAAASGVSGGGGMGGTGGGNLRTGGGGARGGGARRGGSAVGEVNLAGGGPGARGAGGGEKGEKDNPLSDMLAKLFPQDQNGKTVVDARQIASAAGGLEMENPQDDPAVTPTDLSIFEQISSKYRQLNYNGRF